LTITPTSRKARLGLNLLKEVEHSAPDFRSPHFYLMRIDLDLRDYPEFLAEGERTAQEGDDSVLKDIMASARAGYVHGGDRGLLNALYAKQKDYYRQGKLHASMLAATCVLTGKKQEALTILEDAYNQHDVEILAMLSHPDLLTLKDEPHYQALARKINSPPSRTERLATLQSPICQSCKEHHPPTGRGAGDLARFVGAEIPLLVQDEVVQR
jgi:hypothetical protein